MRAGKNPITGENEIYLDDAEVVLLQEMVRGACLPLRRVFNKLLTEI